MTDTPNEQPVIDYDELSWGDAQELAQLGLVVQAEYAKETPDAATIASTFKGIEAIIAPIIISVPRSWFVKRAPENVDVCKDGFRWLKKDRFLDLTNAVMVRNNEVEDDTKN